MPKHLQCLMLAGMHPSNFLVSFRLSPNGNQQSVVCLKGTAVLVGKTAISCMYIIILEMNSAIEMNSPQAVHRRMEEGLNDQTDIGNEMGRPETRIERGRKSLRGDMKSIGGEEKRLGALKEMAIVEGAGKESAAEKKERKGTTTVMRKMKLEKRIKSCIGDFPQKWTDRQKKWKKWERKDIPTDQKTTKRRKREDTIHQTNTDISRRKNINITMNIRKRNVEVNVVTAVVQTATMINRVCILSGYLR